MYETRRYQITLTEPLLGTIPKNRKIFTQYVLSKYPDPDDDMDPTLQDEKDTQKEQEAATAPDGSGETGFHTDPDGIYILDYHFKGFLKEAGNVLKETLKISALRSKIDNYVFVNPRYIWLKERPDGRLERPLRAQTRQGPRVSLVASDYVDAGTSFEVELILLPGCKKLTWDVIEALLDYGKFKGLGQWRNGSYGRFTWKRLA